MGKANAERSIRQWTFATSSRPGKSIAPETGGAQPSASSASPAPMPKSNLLKGLAAPAPRTIANDADGTGREQLRTVRANPLKLRIGTDADGEDANLPSQSAPEKYAGGRSYELCP